MMWLLIAYNLRFCKTLFRNNKIKEKETIKLKEQERKAHTPTQTDAMKNKMQKEANHSDSDMT